MGLKKNREFAQKSETNQQKYRFKTMDLIIPVISLIAFLLLTVYIYIPQINDALEYNTQIQALVVEEKKLTQNREIVRKLEESQDTLIIQNKLAKKVIPQSLAVSDFTFEVNRIAKELGLNLQSITTSDINANVSEEFAYTTGVAMGITGPLKYDGSLEDVIAFLELIKVESPYLIQTSEIKINKYADFEDKWGLDISITGFYMEEFPDQTVNPLGNIRLYDTMDELITELENRSAAMN